MFVLILGGSRPQYSAVQACQELKYDFIVFDGDEECFVTRYLSRKNFMKVNITNVGAVFKAINQLPQKIEACITTQTDVAIRTQSEVNKKYNLLGIRPIHVKKVLDKFEMSVACNKSNVNHPKTILFKNIDQTLENFSEQEIVIKPTDASGSKGVFKLDLNNQDDIKKIHYYVNESQKYSSSKQVIIQEYINGVEVGAQFFYLKKEEPLFVMHDDQVGGNFNNIPIGHSMPSKVLTKHQKICKNYIQKFIKKNNLPEGPYNVDFIIKNNQVFLIEIGARVGATGLQELTYHHIGIDLIREQIKLITNRKVNINVNNNSIPGVSKMIFVNKKGVCKRIQRPNINEISKKMGVIFNNFDIDIEIGDKLLGFNSGRDRVGYMIVTSKNIENCFRAIKKVENEIVIS